MTATSLGNSFSAPLQPYGTTVTQATCVACCGLRCYAARDGINEKRHEETWRPSLTNVTRHQSVFQGNQDHKPWNTHQSNAISFSPTNHKRSQRDILNLTEASGHSGEHTSQGRVPGHVCLPGTARGGSPAASPPVWGGACPWTHTSECSGHSRFLAGTTHQVTNSYQL